MARYRLTQRANRDLTTLWRYIARDSEIHEDRFIDRLMRAIGTVAEYPHIGRRRDTDLGTGVYSFPVEDYVILYPSISKAQR